VRVASVVSRCGGRNRPGQGKKGIPQDAQKVLDFRDSVINKRAWKKGTIIPAAEEHSNAHSYLRSRLDRGQRSKS
jgi:Na+-transporting NADH:ubiquinone oxidoreductase subunit NqrF